MDSLSGYATSPVSLRAALYAPASCIPRGHPDSVGCSGCLFRRHAIRRQSIWSMVYRPGRRTPAAYGWHSFFSCRLIAADNFLWRIASWTASFTFVGSDRRFASRHFPPSDRSRAELFFRSAAGHADQPYYRHLQCGLSQSRTCSSGTCCRRALPRFAAIALIGTVSLPMAAALIVDRRRNGDCNVSSGGCRWQTAA